MMSSSSRCTLLIMPYLSYSDPISLNLHLFFKTSTKNPRHFAFTPSASNAPAPIVSGAASIRRSTSYSLDVSMVLYQNCLPKPLSYIHDAPAHRISAVSAGTFTASTPIASSYPAMSAPEITGVFIPLILYLEECAADKTMPTLLLMIPYDTYASLHCMGSVIKYLQALIAHPTSMLILDKKTVNALFHQILPPLLFETSLANKLQQSLMDIHLQSL